MKLCIILHILFLVGLGIVTAHDVDKECPVFCTAEYRPICAYSRTEGVKTFPNKCAMEAENKCGKIRGFTFSSDGEC